MATAKDTSRAVRGPYRKGLKRRLAIVQAAARTFGQYGYHGASLRQIAEQVGTTNATLIAYFGNKEGLLVAVLEHWRDESRPETEHFDGLEYFRAFTLLMRYHESRRGLIELFLTMSIEAAQRQHPARPFIVDRQQASIDSMTRNLAFAERNGQIHDMSPEAMQAEARLLIATLDGLELQWIQADDFDLETMVRRHIDFSIARWSNRPLDVVARETEQWLEKNSDDVSLAPSQLTPV